MKDEIHLVAGQCLAHRRAGGTEILPLNLGAGSGELLFQKTLGPHHIQRQTVSILPPAQSFGGHTDTDDGRRASTRASAGVNIKARPRRSDFQRCISAILFQEAQNLLFQQMKAGSVRRRGRSIATGNWVRMRPGRRAITTPGRPDRSPRPRHG